MAGNINKLLSLFSLFLVYNCHTLAKNDKKENVYITLDKDIFYNEDIVNYYLVNKTNHDIKVLCNPDFFQREKDSLVINTWANPKISIMIGKKIIEPDLFKIDYKKKVVDSLSSIKEKYVEIESSHKIRNTELDVLKKYIRTVKKDDSIKFSTKFNFETDKRFYDKSEIEGYILKKDNKYNLRIGLNENLNPRIKKILEKENVYSQKIWSNPVRLIFIKTNYSE